MTVQTLLSDKPDVEDAQLRTLLEDQKSLICSLKEEATLLAARLERSLREHRLGNREGGGLCRNEIKSLKKEKKELEERLRKVLSV